MSIRKALVVGINYYKNFNSLCGCVNDANAVNKVLKRHSDSDESINFDTELVTCENANTVLTKHELKIKVRKLFEDKIDIALFYFAGHGYIESTGGFLMTSECNDGDEGLPTNDLMQIVNASPARNKIIILDACHSGIAGNSSQQEDKAVLKEGITILTASSPTQDAREENGSGIFTTLLVDALNGAATNLVGDITPGSIYGHIDQSLSSWEQRPMFKNNIMRFVTLRKVQPPISLKDLRQITQLFENKKMMFPLDPSFEPEGPCPIKENTARFAILQKYNRVNLVVPVDADHMYHAAILSKSCKLTVLGEHYWTLVKKEKI